MRELAEVLGLTCIQAVKADATMISQSCRVDDDNNNNNDKNSVENDNADRLSVLERPNGVQSSQGVNEVQSAKELTRPKI